jgi:hypothetical protein
MALKEAGAGTPLKALLWAIKMMSSPINHRPAMTATKLMSPCQSRRLKMLDYSRQSFQVLIR